jgi:hypothetical protein
VETGKAILDWCNQGTEPLSIEQQIEANTDEIIKRVESCKTVNELIALYKLYPKQPGKPASSIHSKEATIGEQTHYKHSKHQQQWNYN